MSSWNVTLDTVPLGVCALLFATGQNLFILMACPLLLLFLHSSSFVTDFSCHGTECSLWCIYDEEEASSSSLKNLRDVLLTFQRFSTALILMYTYYQQQVRQNSIKIHHFLLLLLSSSTLGTTYLWLAGCSSFSKWGPGQKQIPVVWLLDGVLPESVLLLRRGN